MSTESLFGEASAASGAPSTPSPAPAGTPRLQVAQRGQVVLLPTSLEDLVPADHRVRAVWAFVEGLDLTALRREVRSVEGGAGRPAIDPRILLALWLYATVEGVGSARALARLCEEHAVYRWVCGGVGVNHHTLADFRVGHGAVLDGLLTQSVAALMVEKVVDLQRVAQDGMRVRASAGAPSFRRGTALRECLAQAQEQVAALRREVEADPAGTTRRQGAARERAARERLDRVKRALEHREEAASRKETVEEQEATRASTTDPEARVMKMADGGFRPAFNVQLATDTATQVIAGVEVTNRGNDYGEAVPMIAQVEARYGVVPAEMLVDGGFAARQDIEELEERGVAVYAPVMRSRKARGGVHDPKPKDGPGVAAWRQRMGTDAARTVYRERAATAECVNALARNRGLRAVVVRGLAKVRAVATLFALAHNCMRRVALLPAAAAGA